MLVGVVFLKCRVSNSSKGSEVVLISKSYNFFEKDHRGL